MPLITWNASLSVNIKDMDSQHQVLINLTNLFHDALTQGKGSAVVNDVVEKMVSYAKHHFKDEEMLMAAHHYPGLSKQKSQHEAFLAKAIEFQQQLSSLNRPSNVMISNYLKDWLASHIMKEDKLYGAFLYEKGVK